MSNYRIPDYRTARWIWLKKRVRDGLVSGALMVLMGIGWVVLCGVAIVAFVVVGMVLDPLFPDSIGNGDGSHSGRITVGPGISSDYWGAGCDPAGDYAC